MSGLAKIIPFARRGDLREFRGLPEGPARSEKGFTAADSIPSEAIGEAIGHLTGAKSVPAGVNVWARRGFDPVALAKADAVLASLMELLYPRSEGTPNPEVSPPQGGIRFG